LPVTAHLRWSFEFQCTSHEHYVTYIHQLRAEYGDYSQYIEYLIKDAYKMSQTGTPPESPRTLAA
jgi:hypothetical protein